MCLNIRYSGHIYNHGKYKHFRVYTRKRGRLQNTRDQIKQSLYGQNLGVF